jgi:hypothetical protein
MSQPAPLTKAVRRGLESVSAFLHANQFDESDLYTGASKAERSEIDRAVQWVSDKAYERKPAPVDAGERKP